MTIKTEHKIVFTFIDHFPIALNHSCLKQTSIFLTLSFLQLSFELGIQTWNNTVAFRDNLRDMRVSLDTDTVFEFGWVALFCFVLVFFPLCVGFFFLFFIIFFSSITVVLLVFVWKILVLQTKRKLLSQFSPFNREGLFSKTF